MGTSPMIKRKSYQRQVVISSLIAVLNNQLVSGRNSASNVVATFLKNDVYVNLTQQICVNLKICNP